MKYAWMEGQRTDYPLDEMCTVLAVSESGIRAWRQGGTPNRTRLTDAQMLTWIRAIHEELRVNGQGVAGARDPGQQGTG